MNLRRGFPVLLDLALTQVGILLSYLVRFGNGLFLYRNAWGPYFDIWVIFNLLQLFLLYFYNLYTKSEYQDYLDILESVVKAVSLGTVAVAFIAFFARAFALPRSIVMAPGSPTPSCDPGWRWAALYLGQRRAEPKRALIYGTGELARLVKEQIESWISLSARYDLAGFVSREEASDSGIGALLGSLQELEELIKRERIDEVIYGPDQSSAEELAELTRRCKSAVVNTAITPELFELVTGELYLGYELDSLPLADLDSSPPEAGIWGSSESSISL